MYNWLRRTLGRRKQQVADGPLFHVAWEFLHLVHNGGPLVDPLKAS